MTRSVPSYRSFEAIGAHALEIVSASGGRAQEGDVLAGLRARFGHERGLVERAVRDFNGRGLLVRIKDELVIPANRFRP